MGKKGRVGSNSEVLDSLLGRASALQRFAKRFVAFPGESQQDKFTSDLIRKLLVTRRFRGADGSSLKVTANSALAEYDPAVPPRDAPIHTWEAEPPSDTMAGYRTDTQNKRHRHPSGKPVIDVFDGLEIDEYFWRSIFALDVTDGIVAAGAGGLGGHGNDPVTMGADGYLYVRVDAEDGFTASDLHAFLMNAIATDGFVISGDGNLYLFVRVTDGFVVDVAGYPTIKLDETAGITIGDTATAMPLLTVFDGLSLGTAHVASANRFLDPRANLVSIGTLHGFIRTPWEIAGRSGLALDTARQVLRDQILFPNRTSTIKVDDNEQHWVTPLYVGGVSEMSASDRAIVSQQGAFRVIDEDTPRITLSTPFTPSTDFVVTTRPDSGNLIINPSFTNGTAGWTPNSGVVLEPATGGVTGPDGSPCVTATSTHIGPQNSFAMFYQVVPSRPGVHYKFNFYVKRSVNVTTFGYVCVPLDRWAENMYSGWGHAPLDGSWMLAPYINGHPYFLHCYGVPGHLYPDSTSLYTVVGCGVWTWFSGAEMLYFDSLAFEELPKDQYPDHVV